jgi:hypothetical protein
MIIWGGSDWDGKTGGALTTGGRYDPSADSWTATSTGANNPIERGVHTAVWTGSEMIVWGGGRNDGGRYDPVTDSWLETSTGSGVPSPRTRESAVWTGIEMIVWGGRQGSLLVPVYDDGGRYDPSADSWVATSLEPGTPEPVGQHSAVWTGSEMIVWGGFPLTANGGRYCGCPTPMTSYPDADGDDHGDPDHVVTTCDGSIPPDHVSDPGDCDDANGDIWSVPGEISDLSWSSKAAFGWSAPELPGGVPEAVVYDCLRSESPSDFGSAVCVESNAAATASTDSAEPASMHVYFYLVRAENGCGGGPLGVGSNGPRPAGIDCEE